jgi:hypothetical protein
MIPSPPAPFLPMTFLARTLVFAASLLFTGTAAAQPSCRHGPADDRGISVSLAALAHPTRVAAVVDSVLRAQGYAVSASPEGVGSWRVAPRFTWLPEVESESWHGAEHPGVQVTVRTEARGDSTGVAVGAQALCRVPAVQGGSESIDEMAELISGMLLAAGITQGMDSLEAAGVDPLTPVSRQRTSVEPPREAAGFRIIGRRDYPDPRLGTNIRYGRDGDDLYVDLYVYPGVRVDSACDAACAVDTEADGFIRDSPELVRAGHVQSFELKDDERLRPDPGAPWAYGRHLTFTAKREGETLDSQYYLYSFPGFFVKVRATYPQDAATARADVQAFVEDLLRKLVSG